MSNGFCVVCGRRVLEGELRCEQCGANGGDVGVAPVHDETVAARDRRPTRFPLVPALLVLGIVSLLGTTLVPNFMRARARGQSSECRANLKNIATALEMYAADNKGAFPPTLAEVTPAFLARIPTCSSTRSDTYSGGYASANVRSAHAYTVVCSGYNHASTGYPANFPQFTSARGLLDR